MLLSPAQLKHCDALALHARRAFTGASKGEKRSTKRGSSVEFADFRAYNYGDDIRRIDWNAYARFDRLFLKMFLEEEDLDISILLDGSASMSFGQPQKWRAATQIAGALSYIGLTNFDRVTVALWNENGLQIHPPARGKGAISPVFEFLERHNAGGNADFSEAAKRFALRSKRSGLAFVISDFLFPGGYESGLKTLAARGFEMTAIQLLSREELEPKLLGDLKLVDSESGQIKEISVSASLLRRYRANLENYTRDLRGFCLRYGMNFVQTGSDIGAEDVVSRLLRGTGVVK